MMNVGRIHKRYVTVLNTQTPDGRWLEDLHKPWQMDASTEIAQMDYDEKYDDLLNFVDTDGEVITADGGGSASEAAAGVHSVVEQTDVVATKEEQAEKERKRMVHAMHVLNIACFYPAKKYFDNLPTPVFLHVLSYLRFPVVWKLCTVAKVWYQTITQQPALWTRFNFTSTRAGIFGVRDDTVCSIVSIRSAENGRSFLRDIVLEKCHLISDKSLECIGSFCAADLRALNLARCPEITDAGVLCVLQRCQQLTLLDVSECEQVTDETLVRMIASRPVTKDPVGVDEERARSASSSARSRSSHNRGPLGRQTQPLGPRLASLFLHGCHNISSTYLVDLITACSSLTFLNFSSMGCIDRDVLGRFAPIFAARPSLRMNVHSRFFCPPEMTIVCDRCHMPLFTKLQSYLIDCPAQTHLSTYLLTMTPPDAGATTDSTCLGRKGTMKNCKNNCQGVKFIVDHGSGYVDLKGFAYGVAIGPKYGRIL